MDSQNGSRQREDRSTSPWHLGKYLEECFSILTAQVYNGTLLRPYILGATCNVSLFFFVRVTQFICNL
jgi:hypothetical protein